MLCACFVGSEKILMLCKMLIYFISFFIYPWNLMYVQMLWCCGYLYFCHLFLFILSSGMEYRTLSQVRGRLYLPIF